MHVFLISLPLLFLTYLTEKSSCQGLNMTDCLTYNLQQKRYNGSDIHKKYLEKLKQMAYMIPNLLNYSVPLNNRTLCELSIPLLKQRGYSFRMSSIPNHAYFRESRSIRNDTYMSTRPLTVKNTTDLPSVFVIPIKLINGTHIISIHQFLLINRTQINSQDMNVIQINTSIHMQVVPAGPSFISKQDKIIKTIDHYSFPIFFLSLRMIADSALTVRKRNCEEIGGTYDTSVGICILPSDSKNCTDKRDCLTKTLTKGIDSFVTYVIGMFGTVASILCLLILLITYTLFNKELQALPGKNVMCLSGTLMLTHTLYIISLHANFHLKLCTAVGILLHWSVMFDFLWMAVIAFDLYITFRKPLRLSSMQRTRRFRIYVGLTSGISILMIVICVTLEFSGRNLMGYGIRNNCFVNNFWANLFAVVVPIAFILLFNTIFLTLTITSIYVTQKQVEGSLSKNRKCRNNKLHLTLMTLKLTTLTGLGWIFGFVASLLQSSALTYLFIALITFQGLFVFIGFVCTKRIWKLYRKKLQNEKLRSSSNASKKATTAAVQTCHSQETDLQETAA